MNLWPQVERLLSGVEKPGRYINGELNSSHRSSDGRISIALAYPDVYEVGLSNLGLQILYQLINERDDAVAERVYAPWVDMETEMRRTGLPLFSLEGHRPVAEFDIVGFTLQHELTYSNVLNMLGLAGLPLLSDERGGKAPLVIAGGPGAFSPEPLAPFIDAFAIGDGELLVPDIIRVVREAKEAGAGRRELLEALSVVPGVYVPSLYEVDYADDGRLAEVRALGRAPVVVTRRLLGDLNEVPLPTKPIVPFMDVVHDRCVVEVMRGCTRGCRFCQAGIVYRPARERSKERVIENVKRVVASTGYDEVSFASLSTADHSEIADILRVLAGRYGREVALSLPSLRVDSLSVEMVAQIAKAKKTGLTFAPEAGTQRLRDVVNKGVTKEDLLGAAAVAFESGWQRLKLYFMIGLPTESDEDVESIASLAKAVHELGRRVLPPSRRGRLSVVASVSSFVPKAQTPFQWVAQDAIEETERKQALLMEKLKGKGLTLRWHDSRASAVEGVIARGDRRVAGAIAEARNLGCRFDAWSNRFDYGRWIEAFTRTGVDPAFHRRARDLDEILPWSHIDSGVTDGFLKGEFERALAAVTTPDCRSGRCGDCGVCPKFGVENVFARRDGCAATADQVR